MPVTRPTAHAAALIWDEGDWWQYSVVVGLRDRGEGLKYEPVALFADFTMGDRFVDCLRESRAFVEVDLFRRTPEGGWKLLRAWSA